MKEGFMRGVVAVAAGGLLAVPVVSAEEPARAIPTLLIKGEVVTVDRNDPTTPLLKVKDRYGFETPIYLTSDTKVTQGDQASTVESLSQGTSVEVEYNFDINTAKRHAVSIKLSAPSAPAASSESATPAAAAPETSMPAASAPAAPDAMAAPQAAPEDSEPAMPSEPAPAGESNTEPAEAGQ